MGEFCEFEIDFGLFEDLRAVRVCDECGEHEDLWFYRLDGLKAENDKLRELLRESLMDYKLYAKKYGLPPYLSDVNEHLDARLRELGIEVER